MLRGTPVSPGIAIGRVYVLDRHREDTQARRVSSEEAHHELNRFREALDTSREQIVELRGKLEGEVGVEELRILDVHEAYLNDPIFITDVENRVLKDGLNIEAAIDRVIRDFTRILKLVENDYLRERAQDLSDIALRVLRNLEPTGSAVDAKPAGEAYVLAAPELTVTDMFHLPGERVSGIIAEEVGITSHAAILARSMKIPTVTGIEDLLEKVVEGEEVIVDGSEGVVRLRPDDALRAEYAQDVAAEKASEKEEDQEVQPTVTSDGATITVMGTCGNLHEVEQTARAGLAGVGMYRTELLFLVDKDLPEEEELVQHYTTAVEKAAGGAVTFRLLDLQSDIRPDLFHDGEREPNPSLGVRSMRVLRRNQDLLRRQLRAILRAAPGGAVRILVPFVLDVADIRMIKEILFDEREFMRREGIAHCTRYSLGAMLEIPAALLAVRKIAAEVDFLAVGVDNVIQYLLAADRKNQDLRRYYTTLHPVVLRAIEKAVAVARQTNREIVALGEVVSRPELVPLFLGIGLRHFSVSPIASRAFREAISQNSTTDARERAKDFMDQHSFAPLRAERAPKHGFGI